MKQDNPRERLEQDLLAFATKHSILRVKLNTLNFDLDYQRDDDGQLYLHTQKAVIRTLGKTTKVPIGDDHPYQTFEEAEEATKKYWQEYYKKVRARRSDRERRAEAKRQKLYRERKKAESTKFERQQ